MQLSKSEKTQNSSFEIHSELSNIHNELRKKALKDWNRVIPFDELLFDRWEKAKFLKAKKGSSVYHNNYIFGKVIIGKNTWVGPYTLLDGSGGILKIGDFCSISSGVQIYTHQTVKWALTGGKATYEKNKVTIGSCCYLGPYSVVTMGVKIGRCSVIGAHSLVNHDIPAYSIVFGIPAKVVGKVKIQGKKVEFIYFNKSNKE